MPTIWSDTFLLMALGMGTVFTFLVILIASVTAMSAVIKRLHPPAEDNDSNSEVDIAAVAAIAYQLHHQPVTQYHSTK
jgi:sodium pump decarboxylase gamma subunit